MDDKCKIKPNIIFNTLILKDVGRKQITTLTPAIHRNIPQPQATPRHTHARARVGILNSALKPKYTCTIKDIPSYRNSASNYINI